MAFPECIAGMYVPDELTPDAAVSEDGDTAEILALERHEPAVSASVGQSAQPVNQTPAPTPTPLAQTEHCRSCQAPIVWGKTAAGKDCPYDVDHNGDATTISHFTTCPDAGDWSKRKTTAKAQPRVGECDVCHADSELDEQHRCVDREGCSKRAGAIKAPPADAPPVTDWDGEPDPPSTVDATLAADLDAAFTAQAPAVALRYPKTSAGQAAFLADCKGKLGLELPDIKAALGGSVSEYMKATGATLDAVYTVLVNKALDNVAVPGRLGETTGAE
jgi:hypothetical protein